MQPFNTRTGIEHTLDTALAQVWHDGWVFWSRPGVLELLCRYSGLVAFPFDDLRCSTEIGGWAYSGLWQALRPSGDGFALLEEQEVTAEGEVGVLQLLGVAKLCLTAAAAQPHPTVATVPEAVDTLFERGLLSKEVTICIGW